MLGDTSFADVMECCMGVSEKFGVPYFVVLIIRILLFRVLYEGFLLSETPIWCLQGVHVWGRGL